MQSFYSRKFTTWTYKEPAINATCFIIWCSIVCTADEKLYNALFWGLGCKFWSAVIFFLPKSLSSAILGCFVTLVQHVCRVSVKLSALIKRYNFIIELAHTGVGGITTSGIATRQHIILLMIILVHCSHHYHLDWIRF